MHLNCLFHVPVSRFSFVRSLVLVMLGWAAMSHAAQAQQERLADSAAVQIQWGVKIPLRDHVDLNATVYRPKGAQPPSPCVFTLTPYISDAYHDRGTYFATQGIPFLVVDVRGRGNSGGTFKPNLQEIDDGYDVVEWLAQQPYCNGKVAMWGGSYAGYDQWATAKNRPPHLATIVPAAAAYPGIDFPFRNNIATPEVFQWLTFVSGRTLQPNLYGDRQFWSSLWRERFIAGAPFANLEHALGGEQPQLREWLSWNGQGSGFDQYTPSPDDYRAMTLPVLSITGSYDDDQPGALAYYRRSMQHGSQSLRDNHYLIIGPWDHGGTRTPTAAVGGVKFGPASLVDLPALHTQWYRWTMSGGPKPAFLQKKVAYYVMGADIWRYADTLDAVTDHVAPYYLGSRSNANQLAAPGSLTTAHPSGAQHDHYRYDPNNTGHADLEATTDPLDPADTRMLEAQDGENLVYETAPFRQAQDVSGFFSLTAWIAIDQPDTDFRARVYEVFADGRSIFLTTDSVRARHRTSLQASVLISTTAPQQYDFRNFTFTSRRLAPGSRLRLVVGPINSIYAEKNYNAAKRVAEQSLTDARTVTVTLRHDRRYPSALFVPFAAKME